MKYKEKPPTVEAMKFDGKNADEIAKMVQDAVGENGDPENTVYAVDGTALLIQRPYGSVILVPKDDYVVVNTWGEVQAMAAEKFEAKFEAA